MNMPIGIITVSPVRFGSLCGRRAVPIMNSGLFVMPFRSKSKKNVKKYKNPIDCMVMSDYFPAYTQHTICCGEAVPATKMVVFDLTISPEWSHLTGQ